MNGFDLLWTLLIIGGTVALGIGVYHLIIGLDKASQVIEDAFRPHGRHTQAIIIGGAMSLDDDPLRWGLFPDMPAGLPDDNGAVSGACWDDGKAERWPGHEDPGGGGEGSGRPPQPADQGRHTVPPPPVHHGDEWDDATLAWLAEAGDAPLVLDPVTADCQEFMARQDAETNRFTEMGWQAVLVMAAELGRLT